MNYKGIGKPDEFLDFREYILKECLNSDLIHFEFENPEIQKHFTHTHTQCVFHIIRLRLIIFHTPKFFQWRFSL